jgi:hypothetical protein
MPKFGVEFKRAHTAPYFDAVAFCDLAMLSYGVV